MAEIDTTLIVLVGGSFLAALSNAAFSAGGALIILALTSIVLPVAAIVPIHSTLLIGSTTARSLFFRRNIEWKIVTPFLAGSVFAVAAGSRIYVELPEKLIATSISLIMLIAIWLPGLKFQPAGRYPWAIVGFVHSLISTLFAYGAVFHAIILHTGLKRRQIVGTMAAGLTGMGIFKIAGYAVNGFDYTPYIRIIVLCTLAAFVGTWVGKLVIDRISEQVFHIALRTLITLTAARLLYVGIVS